MRNRYSFWMQTFACALALVMFVRLTTATVAALGIEGETSAVVDTAYQNGLLKAVEPIGVEKTTETKTIDDAEEPFEVHGGANIGLESELGQVTEVSDEHTAEDLTVEELYGEIYRYWAQRVASELAALDQVHYGEIIEKWSGNPFELNPEKVDEINGIPVLHRGGDLANTYLCDWLSDEAAFLLSLSNFHASISYITGHCTTGRTCMGAMENTYKASLTTLYALVQDSAPTDELLEVLADMLYEMVGFEIENDAVLAETDFDSVATEYLEKQGRQDAVAFLETIAAE